MISQWKHDNKHGIGWDLAERHQAFQDVNDNSLKFMVKSEKRSESSAMCTKYTIFCQMISSD